MCSQQSDEFPRPSAEVIDDAVAVLGDSSRARTPDDLSRDRGAASRPGLYAWWADAEAVATLSTVLRDHVQPLIYIGQAGATKIPSRARSPRTIADRVFEDELRRPLEGSTFRISLAAALREPLGLHLSGKKRLDPASADRLTAWMRQHLRVVIYPYDDRDSLELLKQATLSRLNPSLIAERSGGPSPVRARLSALREGIIHGH